MIEMTWEMTLGDDGRRHLSATWMTAGPAATPAPHMDPHLAA